MSPENTVTMSWRPRHAAYDVIVVGARPAGASTALLLARAGLSVLVVVGAGAVLGTGIFRVVTDGRALFPDAVTGWSLAFLTALIVGHLVALGRDRWWSGTGSGHALTLAILLLYGWTPAVLAGAGLATPVTPRKGHVLVLERSPVRFARKLSEAGYLSAVEAGGDDGLQVAMVVESTPSGTTLVGSSREHRGFDDSVRYDTPLP